MKDVTATEAARHFSNLLDSVEHRNETYVIRRGGKTIARIGPVSESSGKAVKKLLREFIPDKSWEADLAAIRANLTSEERSWTG